MAFTIKVSQKSYSAASYSNTSGTYPVSSNGSANGTITNSGTVTLYIYGVFNSGGNTSGTISMDYITLNAGSPIYFTGPITTSGQTFTAGYFTLSPGNSVSTFISKTDNLTLGCTIRMGYATSIGGSVTTL